MPLDEAVERITSARKKIKFYEAGMDLNLSDKKVTSFKLFQSRILSEYEKMVPEFGFHVIDATQPIQNQQKEIRKLINQTLQGWQGLPSPVLSAQNYMREKKASFSQNKGANG